MMLQWRLTAPQFEFFTNDARFKAFISGIGAGKTSVGWACAVKEATENPGSLGLIVAPTYPLIRDVIWRETERWLPREIIADFNETKKLLRLRNGSEILFRSADNPRHIERLRGLSIAWFWIDECTLLPKLVWDILIGRLRQRGFNHRAWITGTPKGFDWVYDIFIRDPIPDSFILKEISTETNVFLSTDYIRALREQYTGQFALQEIEGRFVQFEGLVYPSFSPETHITDELPEFDRVVYGVDWGFRNPAAILAIGIAGDEFFIADEIYGPRMTDDDLLTLAKHMQQRHGIGTFFCDPSEPASIEKFRAAGIDAVKAKNEIAHGIRAVTSLIESEKLKIHRKCKNTISEIQAYRYDENNREVPLKINDHAMDALRYAILGVQGAPTVFRPIALGGKLH